MECRDVQERLPGLLAGTLPAAEEQRVLAHLAGCADCRAELAFWARVSDAVAAEAPAAAPQVLAEVHDALFGRPAADWLTLTRDSLDLVRVVCRTALRLAAQPV